MTPLAAMQLLRFYVFVSNHETTCQSFFTLGTYRWTNMRDMHPVALDT